MGVRRDNLLIKVHTHCIDSSSAYNSICLFSNSSPKSTRKMHVPQCCTSKFQTVCFTHPYRQRLKSSPPPSILLLIALDPLKHNNVDQERDLHFNVSHLIIVPSVRFLCGTSDIRVQYPQMW